jgi:hypothetical protein
MVGTLIDHLTRGIAILDFGDCKGGRLALRQALPNRIAEENGRVNADKAR